MSTSMRRSSQVEGRQFCEGKEKPIEGLGANKLTKEVEVEEKMEL